MDHGPTVYQSIGPTVFQSFQSTGIFGWLLLLVTPVLLLAGMG